jgi:hypothetical protein
MLKETTADIDKDIEEKKADLRSYEEGLDTELERRFPAAGEAKPRRHPLGGGGGDKGV